MHLLGEQPARWQRSDLSVEGVPLQGANPYDPDQIALDATIAAPSNAKVVVPLFWYVGFSRSLEKSDQGEQEKVTPDPQMTGEWRLRWTPRETGEHTLVVTVRRRTASQTLSPLKLRVSPQVAGARGFVSVEPTQKRFFRTDDGRPLPLLGMNACWPGRRGTYDYDDWFPAMGRNSMNYTRLWQGNSGFRAELYPGERLNYNQAALWQLDRVFDVAAQNGIDIMLCMGFHGEFQTEPDDWGGTGFWATHAYNAKNGAPAKSRTTFLPTPPPRSCTGSGCATSWHATGRTRTYSVGSSSTRSTTSTATSRPPAAKPRA